MRFGRLVRIFAGVAALVIVVGVAVALRGPSSGARFHTKALAGQAPSAPLLVASALSGHGPALDLASLRGRAVLVNFWASWCDPCQSEAPILEQLSADAKKLGVIMAGVDTKDITSDGLAFVRQYRLTYPMYEDGERRAYGDWGLTGVPETFVIDRQGRVIGHWNQLIREDMPAVRSALAKAAT